MAIASTDKYRIVGEVGSGGMGIVYHAVQTRLDRHVAIKVLKPRYARDPGFVQRFRQEARALAALPLTHIVQIYDVERVGDDLWIVMEWVDGRTLRDVLKDEGPLGWERTLGLIRQCTEALAAAHDAGILHRDVKPENVLLTSDDTVKIMDFGVALFLDPERNAPEDTSVGAGSPRYMAPEQLAGETSDARADQYALALMAFELITGEFPFPGEDIYAIGYEKLHSEALHLRDFWDEAPAAVDAALAAALHRDPAERFADLREFLRAIDPPPPRKLPLTPFVLGVAVTMGVLLGGFYFLRPLEAPPVVARVAPAPLIQQPAPAPQPPPELEPEPEPDPVVPLVLALDELLLEEKYAEAEEVIDEILSHETDHPRARGAREQVRVARAQEQLLADAVALYESGALGEAKGMFRAVLVARPDDPTAQEYVARLARRARVDSLLAAARVARADRERTNAKQAYRDVLALDPKHAVALRELAAIQAEEARDAKLAAADKALATGDLPRAQAAYAIVQHSEPKNMAAARGLARIAAIQRGRDRFDAAAFATALRAGITGLQNSVEVLTDAVSAREGDAESTDVRRVGRTTRAALRRYRQQLAAPLKQLARSVDTAGAELAAFPGRTEKASGRYFASAADRQHNQRDRLNRSVETMIAVLDADGRAVMDAPQRTAQRARVRLFGTTKAEPINREVLVYRRARGGRYRRARGPVDPVQELAAELAPLRDALDQLIAATAQENAPPDSAAAAALRQGAHAVRSEEWAGVAAALKAFNGAHQRRNDRGRTAGATLTTQLETAVAALETRAGAVREQHQQVLHDWASALTAAGKRDGAHFTDVDERTQGVAARLAGEVTEITASISRQLADQQRASTDRLKGAGAERAWLLTEAQQVAALGNEAALIAHLDQLSVGLPERGEARAEVFDAVLTDFTDLGRAAQDRAARYQRARTSLLKTRVNVLQQQVRQTAARTNDWEDAQVDTLRDATAMLRQTGAAVDGVMDQWAEDAGQARARFGQRSRTALRTLREIIDLAVKNAGATEAGLDRLLRDLASRPDEDPAVVQATGEARLLVLAQQVQAVAVGLDAYTAGLDAAATEALAQRLEATQVLVAGLDAAGTALATGATTFEGAVADRSADMDTDVAALLAAGTAALAQFELDAAALEPRPDAESATPTG